MLARKLFSELILEAAASASHAKALYGVGCALVLVGFRGDLVVGGTRVWALLNVC